MECVKCMFSAHAAFCPDCVDDITVIAKQDGASDERKRIIARLLEEAKKYDGSLAIDGGPALRRMADLLGKDGDS